MTTYGKHIVAELGGCNRETISSCDSLLNVCEDACSYADMSVVKSYAHRFKLDNSLGYGCSVFIILEESHLSLHSWPEYGYVALDIYLCGETNKDKPEKALDYIIQELEVKYVHVSELERGIKDEEFYIHRIIGWEEEIKRR